MAPWIVPIGALGLALTLTVCLAWAWAWAWGSQIPAKKRMSAPSAATVGRACTASQAPLMRLCALLCMRVCVCLQICARVCAIGRHVPKLWMLHKWAILPAVQHAHLHSANLQHLRVNLMHRSQNL